MSEVSRLSTRLDAVYRLLQHVENLSIQQPPSRLVHSLQQEVFLQTLLIAPSYEPFLITPFLQPFITSLFQHPLLLTPSHVRYLQKSTS